MAKNLSAGLWIAQGPEINVLVKLKGKSPLLEFVCGIDLNSFNRGVIKSLSKDSREVQEILMYPDKYVFEYPSLSDAVQNVEGLGKTTFQAVPSDEDRDQAILAYYKDVAIAETGDIDKAKNKTAVWIKNEYNLTIGQALTLLSKITKALARKYNNQ